MTDGQAPATGLVLAAFDLETAPDPRVLAFLTPPPERLDRAVLHRVAAAAWLTAEELADGRWRIDGLHSMGAPAEEFDILLELDGFLRDVRGRGGEVCTYNGRAHDLPVLRRRASRHWMWGMDGLFPPEPLRHRDMMLDAGVHPREWPKLREACAALGFGCNAHAGAAKGRPIDPGPRKAETDVVGTLLLRLHALAAERRDRGVLVAAWTALAGWIRDHRPDDPHLRQFTRSAQLEAAVNVAARGRG